MIVLLILIIFAMFISWKLGHDTGWIRGFHDGFRFKRNKKR